MATFIPSGNDNTKMTNLVQDLLAFDEHQVFILPEVVIPLPMSESATIAIENAARLRYFNRTGKGAPLLAGGECNPTVLATLCEACGESEGKPYEAPYTPRPIHLCSTCAKAERAVLEQLNQMFGNGVAPYTTLRLPSRTERR